MAGKGRKNKTAQRATLQKKKVREVCKNHRTEKGKPSTSDDLFLHFRKKERQKFSKKKGEQ